MTQTITLTNENGQNIPIPVAIIKDVHRAGDGPHFDGVEALVTTVHGMTYTVTQTPEQIDALVKEAKGNG